MRIASKGIAIAGLTVTTDSLILNIQQKSNIRCALRPFSALSSDATARLYLSPTLEVDTELKEMANLPDDRLIDSYTSSSNVHFRLLSKDEEVKLARLVQQRVRWEEIRDMLEEELEEEPSFSEWVAAVRRTGEEITDDEFACQLRGGYAAKEMLIAANLRLVQSIARKHKSFSKTRLMLSDLVQEGIFGLAKAADKFDPERGFKFSTYATWWIRQTIMRATDNQGRTIRLPVYMQDKLRSVRRSGKVLHDELGREASKEELAQRLGLTEEKVQWLNICQRMQPRSLSSQRHTDRRPDSEPSSITVGESVHDPNQTPEDFIDKKEMQQDIEDLLCSLKPRERIVLRMRYGLDTGGRRETLKRVAEKIGISSDGVRLIENRALEKLRLLNDTGDTIVKIARSHFV